MSEEDSSQERRLKKEVGKDWGGVEQRTMKKEGRENEVSSTFSFFVLLSVCDSQSLFLDVDSDTHDRVG